MTERVADRRGRARGWRRLAVRRRQAPRASSTGGLLLITLSMSDEAGAWRRSSSSWAPAPRRVERRNDGAARGASATRPPTRGLSSSVQVGLAAIGPELRRGAHPARRPAARVRVAVIRALLAAADARGRAIVVPGYAGWRRPATRSCCSGRRGRLADHPRRGSWLRPAAPAHPELVREVGRGWRESRCRHAGDLARVVEPAWARRVRANRDAGRAGPRGPRRSGLLRPGDQLFRADPTRADDPVLGVLCEHGSSPARRWLDIGAGAGRFALPIARALAGSGGRGHRRRRVARDARCAARDRRRRTDRERPDGRGTLAAGGAPDLGPRARTSR